jgi:hypothetical protein
LRKFNRDFNRASLRRFRQQHKVGTCREIFEFIFMAAGLTTVMITYAWRAAFAAASTGTTSNGSIPRAE